MEPNKLEQPPPYSEIVNQPPQFGQPGPPGYNVQPFPAQGQPQPYAQPTAGYGVPPQPYQHPKPQYTPTSSTTVVIAQPTVRPPGSCLYCGGTKREDFTACGIILAICFFPIGILCCIAMTERRCVNCGRM